MPSVRSIQAPQAVVMIHPQAFTPNPQTAADNSFQRAQPPGDGHGLAARAYDEVTAAVATLEQHGLQVH